jgi:hypothetical protein
MGTLSRQRTDRPGRGEAPIADFAMLPRTLDGIARPKGNPGRERGKGEALPRFLGMEPRVALLVGGAVAVVAFLAWRARSAASAASEEAPPPELAGAGAATGAAGMPAQDQFASQMQALELSSAQQELQFRTGQLKRQEALETAQGAQATAEAQGQADWTAAMFAWLEGKGKKPPGTQCEKGKVKFDPQTRTFYCRDKQHKSLGQAVGGWATSGAKFVEAHPEVLLAGENRVTTQAVRPPAPKRGFGVKKKVTR